MLKKGLSSVIAVFLCLSAQSQNCHATLSKAQQMLKERDYRSCIDLLNDADCNSYEQYNMLMTAYVGVQDYMSVRQWAERHEREDGNIRALALYYNGLALYKQKQLQPALAKMEEAKNAWADKTAAPYAMTCNTLGNILEEQEKYVAALAAYEEALAVYEKMPASDNIYMYQMATLGNIAHVYTKQNNDKASDCYRQAAEIYEKHPEATVSSYMSILNNMGEYYIKNKDYANAVSHFKMVTEVKRERLGKNHPSYAISLLNTATACYNAEQYADAVPYIEEYVQYLRATLQRNFTVMTEQERERYWNAQARALDNLLVIATYATIGSDNPDASLLYDICLLSKSLLLDTQIQLETLISESGDDNLQNMREELRETQKRLLTLDESDGAYLAALSRQCDSLEHALLKTMGSVEAQMKQMQTTWSDVQAHLQNHDMAVEFVCLGTGRDIEYAVVMLRKSWDKPKVVYLNGLAETLAAKQISRMQMHNNFIFGKLVWNAVIKEAKAGDRIWFVPAGELQLMAVEFLSIDDKLRMCDRYEMRRLSSTKQLTSEKQPEPWKTVALLGGMDYNANIDEMEYYAAEYNHLYPTNSERPAIPAEFSAKMWLPLPGALHEVQQIDALLQEKGKTTFAATRDAATSAALYAVSSRSYDIVHIATHGFYVAGNDDAMHQSGLVMAGANTLALQPAPELGNGVMSAAELSKMDFKHTRLAVLSACQTGLGDVTTEGVFGLQRAFKLAGVQSLLVSLWEVNDAVTAALMTAFYKALDDNADFHTAFNTARESIRKGTFNIAGKRVSGNDISLWGAFVLIDELKR